MSEIVRIPDLDGTGKRITVQGVVKERLPIGDDVPLQKFFIQEEYNPKNWVSTVVFDEAEFSEIEHGTSYVFENVIDSRFEDHAASYAPQLQLKADKESNIRPADGGCVTNTNSSDGDDDDKNESEKAKSKANRPILSGPGKSIRTDGSAGERVSGRNPLNDPNRIKDAGLHQGSP